MSSILVRAGQVVTLAALLQILPASASAQALVPRLEPVECFAGVQSLAAEMGADCSWLVVPQLRARPDGPTVRLPVVRVRAKEPSGSPPLVYLHGGPGGQGAIRGNARGIFTWPIARNRDVIVYDHRGAGLSEPKPCPEVVQAIDRRRENPNEDPQQRWDGNARECVTSLQAARIDPLAFTTYNNVLDLIDLRRALGYDRWDLYGVSYGGALAQEAMRHDAAAIRAVVLAYSSTLGPTTQVESPLSYQRSLERVFESCDRQSSCRDAFPSLAQDFYTVYQELERSPADVTIERTGGPTTVLIDGDRFLRELRCQLSGPRTVRRVPILVHQLRAGPRQPALEVLANGCGIGVGFDATIQLVMCHQIYGNSYRRAAAAVRDRVHPTFRPLVGENTECALWQERYADPSSHEFVKSDIPTLLLTGEFDDRSPTEHARRIAGSLSRAWVHELPGESHGGAVQGCHAWILFQFLENPTRDPDASCIATMPRIAFETRSLMIPTLLLDISSGAAAAGFAGVWEAEVLNAPQGVTFDLSIDGPTVTGTVLPQELEIFDGTVQGNLLSFKVKSPDGLRTITFTGELQGEQIAFRRDIEIPPGAPAGDSWIFGALGVRSFVARRAR